MLKCIKTHFAYKTNRNICMSLIPEISNPYLGAFAGGLLYGLVVCTASCLPIVTSYIAGVGAGFGKGVKITMIFNSGRILAYALIGGLIGLFSGLFRLFVSDTVISPFQVYSSLAFGVVTIIIGVSIFWKARKPCDCNVQSTKNTGASPKMGRFGFDVWRLFTGFKPWINRVSAVDCAPDLLVALRQSAWQRWNSSLIWVRNSSLANPSIRRSYGVAS